MLTFLEFLAESNYVLNKHAKWGIVVPHKGKDGFKVISGNDHPTATSHDALAKEHFGMKTDDMLKKHPGTLRYVGQRDDEGKHEFNLELSSHPSSVSAAKKLITHPKHMTSFGHPNPHHMYFEFKDKPHHSFDVHHDYEDDRVKAAHQRLSRIRESILESAPPDADVEKWIMHRKPEFRKRYGKDYKKYLYGKAWTLFNSGKKLHFDESELDETEDAHRHGYNFEVRPDTPVKGQHMVFATHPSTRKIMSPEQWHLWGDDRVKRPGKLVGVATIHDNSRSASGVYVHKSHRRKGVASAMYNAYEKHTNSAMKPSSSQHDDGKALWQSRS